MYRVVSGAVTAKPAAGPSKVSPKGNSQRPPAASGNAGSPGNDPAQVSNGWDSQAPPSECYYPGCIDKGAHYLTRCLAFHAKSVAERREWVEKKCLCWIKGGSKMLPRDLKKFPRDLNLPPVWEKKATVPRDAARPREFTGGHRSDHVTLRLNLPWSISTLFLATALLLGMQIPRARAFTAYDCSIEATMWRSSCSWNQQAVMQPQLTSASRGHCQLRLSK